VLSAKHSVHGWRHKELTSDFIRDVSGKSRVIVIPRNLALQEGLHSIAVPGSKAGLSGTEVESSQTLGVTVEVEPRVLNSGCQGTRQTQLRSSTHESIYIFTHMQAPLLRQLLNCVELAALCQ
jgi:hypothetical protein